MSKGYEILLVMFMDTNVAFPVTSLHENNSECGVKEGNILVSKDFWR